MLWMRWHENAQTATFSAGANSSPMSTFCRLLITTAVTMPPRAMTPTMTRTAALSCGPLTPYFTTVGAMSSATYQSFVNDAYAAVATGNLLVGGTYYDESWSVMSMLMMTGNFLDYTAY